MAVSICAGAGQPGVAAEPKPDVASVEILWIGTYRTHIEGPIEPGHDPHGVAGVVHGSGEAVVADGPIVQMKQCEGFGLRYVIRRGSELPLHVTIRVLHPHLVTPEGQGGDEDSWSDTLIVPEAEWWTGFIFERPWEMVPGTWTMQLLDGDRLLAEQAFDVRPPEEPGIAGLDCAAPLET